MSLWLRLEILTVPLASGLDFIVELRRTSMVIRTHFLPNAGTSFKTFLTYGPQYVPLKTTGDQNPVPKWPLSIWGGSMSQVDTY